MTDLPIQLWHKAAGESLRFAVPLPAILFASRRGTTRR
jgi:hypothetical protein